MVRYTGTPKKRRLYVDDQGRQVPLGKLSGADHYFMVSSSGTLSASGDLTVTGTEFSPDTVVVATYNDSSAGTAPLAVELGDGTATFKGDTSAKFYYIAVNLSV